MASEILQNIATDIKDIDPFIEQAQELISAMKDAGEDTHEQEAELRLLRVRKTKWANMLSTRGL